MAEELTTAVLTVVSARLPSGRDSEVVEAFAELVRQPKPDGLMRTELLTGPDGGWHIHTLWRDHAALEAMRRAPEPPAAPTLLRSFGGEPTLQVLEVRSAFPPGTPLGPADPAPSS